MPAIRGQDSKKKTRRHTRDLDQVHADLRDEKHLAEFKDAKPLEDLPGLGKFYCKECAKFFESENNFVAHQKHKVHKRRCDMSKQVKLCAKIDISPESGHFARNHIRLKKRRLDEA
jgi:hypothetical protein